MEEDEPLLPPQQPMQSSLPDLISIVAWSTTDTRCGVHALDISTFTTLLPVTRTSLVSVTSPPTHEPASRHTPVPPDQATRATDGSWQTAGGEPAEGGGSCGISTDEGTLGGGEIGG